MECRGFGKKLDEQQHDEYSDANGIIEMDCIFLTYPTRVDVKIVCLMSEQCLASIPLRERKKR